MSECEKEYRFRQSEYDIEVWDSKCGWNPLSQFTTINNGEVRITKKKPKGELKWRNITPTLDHGIYANPGKKQPRRMDEAWQNDYRLVQFCLEWATPKLFTKYLKIHVYGTIPCLQTNFSEILRLAHDAINQWSAPVVIPIDFYNNLDKYVCEFNQKLNKCGGE